MADLPVGTVTFFFLDLEGSTRLQQQLRNRYVSLLTDYRSLVRSTVTEKGGVEVDSHGDDFFIVFSRSHDAIRAAIELQRGLSRFAWPEQVSVAARIGVHTGDASLASGTYIGLDVHRAARICRAAHGGQIVLSHTTRSFVEPDLPEGVTIRDLGEYSLKDMPHSEHLFQVVHPELPRDFPPLNSKHLPAHNLPVQLTSFVGRQKEMAEVKRLLAESRLLTLTGFGGGGKTRLALQVAAEVTDKYKDGVWLVELADLTDPVLVPQTVAAVFGIREESRRRKDGGQREDATSVLLDTLADFLQSKHLLLVLDNCEHLSTPCGDLAHRLLRECPRLSILATSRQTLDVSGEIIFRVPALSLPNMGKPLAAKSLTDYEAIKLFIDRAGAVNPDFALVPGNAMAVAQICHKLEGIPLALELAAAQVKVLSVTQIARRLNRGLRLLPGGRRTADRHRTLQAVLDWSYALLSQSERTLLRRLAAFTGSFPLEGVEDICTSDGLETETILDMLASLVDGSLVLVDQQGGEMRYRLLDTVRQYTREKLDEANEAETIRGQHRAWYMALAERSEPMVQISAKEWLDRLETEHSNLRGALEWCQETQDWETTLRLSGFLRRFWLIRGYWSEGRRWLETALANATGAPLGTRAKALEGAASLAQHQADYKLASLLCDQSLSVYRALGDKSGIARALGTLGNVWFEQGEYDTALQLYEESLMFAKDAGDNWAIAMALRNLSNVALHKADYDKAGRLSWESVTLFRGVGDKRGMCFALDIFGLVAHDQGNLIAAQTTFQEALTIQTELGEKRGVGIALTNLGLAASEMGSYDEAVNLYNEALTIRRELGDKRGVATLLCYMGELALKRGEDAEARSNLLESVNLRKAARNKAGVARPLEGLARAFRREPERSAKLLGAMAALREAVGEVRSQPEQIEYLHFERHLRTELSESNFNAAWNEGRAMTLDQAVEYAHARSDTDIVVKLSST